MPLQNLAVDTMRLLLSYLEFIVLIPYIYTMQFDPPKHLDVGAVQEANHTFCKITSATTVTFPGVKTSANMAGIVEPGKPTLIPGHMVPGPTVAVHGSSWHQF